MNKLTQEQQEELRQELHGFAQDILASLSSPNLSLEERVIQPGKPFFYREDACYFKERSDLTTDGSVVLDLFMADDIKTIDFIVDLEADTEKVAGYTRRSHVLDKEVCIEVTPTDWRPAT